MVDGTREGYVGTPGSTANRFRHCDSGRISVKLER